MEAKTAQEVINALGAISNARYLAMDENGEWWAYESKPEISTSFWKPTINNHSCCIGEIVNIQPAENWKESLVEYQLK